MIQFLPPVNNIEEIMVEADCCALFSYYEGLPNTVCEAMALGKPIIATKVSDMQKLIDEESGGYLCDSPSAVSIGKAIRKILLCSDEQLIEMGKHNREKSLLLFDNHKIVSNYLKLLQND